MASVTFYEEPIGLSVAQGALIRWQKEQMTWWDLLCALLHKANTPSSYLGPTVGCNAAVRPPCRVYFQGLARWSGIELFAQDFVQECSTMENTYKNISVYVVYLQHDHDVWNSYPINENPLNSPNSDTHICRAMKWRAHIPSSPVPLKIFHWYPERF